MPDLVVPDVPDDVVAVLDRHANELGQSRDEFLRQELRSQARRSTRPVTVEDLRRFRERFGDLATSSDSVDE